jgi:hypothetical protein
MFICSCDDHRLYGMWIHIRYTTYRSNSREYSYDTIVTLKKIYQYNSMDWFEGKIICEHL